MSQERESHVLELPPREEVERGLDMERGDRPDHPGLYRMNVVRIPLARLATFTLALVVVAIHNLALFGGLGLPTYPIVAAGVLGYCFVSWLALRGWFLRVRSLHLGTVFVWLDLLPLTAMVYASGGERSLLWPIYFARVADQMWISRGRAAALAVGGVVSFALLLLWLDVGQGRPLDWRVEGVKLLALAALSAGLAAVAAQPWSVRDKTFEARDLILRLEQQSRELDQERIRAEAANRAKSEFLARMSHELRTPLNSVIGFANVLLRKAEGRDHDYLAHIHENGLHLIELIDDILDLARIEQGRMDIALIDVDVVSLVRATVDGTARQMEGRMVTGAVALYVSAPDGLAPVRADAGRMRQVLVNLVGNALKFTPSGSVRVEVEPAKDGVRPYAVHVRDTGIGIAPDRLESIFLPFEQADGSASRRYGGVGLGLAVSRSLCDLMGFRLTVESELGRGSVFTIHLAPDGAESPATSPAGRPG